MGSMEVPRMPALRWGLIGTGLMTSWFVEDLLVSRNDAKARHVVRAIGSSSLGKGRTFVQNHCASAKPTIYGSYEELYADDEVDIVYVGTPHSFHKRNCLDIISHGKHILCEKAFTVTAKESEEILAAAKAKGVYIMEAMWLRFVPLVKTLLQKIHGDGVIGDVRRVFCDFAMDMAFDSLGPESRLKNAKYGAGSLLDVGIYPLTWALIVLDPKTGDEAEKPTVRATQTLRDGVDVSSSILLHYPSSGKQGVVTSSMLNKTGRTFCRIEGSTGRITIDGLAASHPSSYTLWHMPDEPDNGEPIALDKPLETFTFARPAGHRGYFDEADAVAIDIAQGRLENPIMPHAETVRVMKILDEVRKQGGAKFPQDDE